MGAHYLNVNNRWKYVLVGIVIMLFLGTVYSYSVLRNLLEQELGMGATASGMPYMVSLATYALFMFFTGRFIEKYSPKKIVILGGLLVSTGWILSSFATNGFFLTLTYGCVSGAGVGICYGVPMAVVAKWFPDKKGLAVGLVLVGFGLSPLVTAPIVRYLAENYGVMKAFLIIGLSFGILLPCLALFLKDPSDAQVSVYKNRKRNTKYVQCVDIPLKEMIRTASFKGVYINFIIGTMIGLMIIGMTSNVGLDYFKLEISTVTKGMALFAISNGLGRPFFGWITDRYSSRTAMLLSYLLIASAALSLVILDNNLLVYLITFSVFWFNLGGWLAIAPTSILKLYGMKHYSQNYGLVFTAYGVGAIAGVLTSGILLDYHGNYQYVFLYIIGLSVFGIVLTLKYIKVGISALKPTAFN